MQQKELNLIFDYDKMSTDSNPEESKEGEYKPWTSYIHKMDDYSDVPYDDSGSYVDGIYYDADGNSLKKEGVFYTYINNKPIPRIGLKFQASDGRIGSVVFFEDEGLKNYYLKEYKIQKLIKDINLDLVRAVDLSSNSFPFKEQIRSNVEILTILEKEFKEARLIIDPEKYRKDFISDEELTKDRKDFNKHHDNSPAMEGRLSKLRKECINKALCGDLEEKYYTHNIKEIPSLKHLQDIYNNYSELAGGYNFSTFNTEAEYQKYSELIFRKIKVSFKLMKHLPIVEMVCEYIINDNTYGLWNPNISKTEAGRAYLIEQLLYYRNELRGESQTTPPTHTENKEGEHSPAKPNFVEEIREDLFGILKNYFSDDEKENLKQIINTGDSVTSKLLFKSNGNKLTDAFRKLYDANLITGCEKTTLINWIITNFQFTKKDTFGDFIYNTVEKTISRNDIFCKNPILDVVDHKLKKL